MTLKVREPSGRSVIPIRRVTVHRSGTDAFSLRKTNIFHGRDQTPKRRLSVKMGLSPSLVRERLLCRSPQRTEFFTDMGIKLFGKFHGQLQDLGLV